MTTKKPSVTKNIIWSSAGSIIDLGCQWLISILVVRLCSSFDAAGVLSLATAIYGIFHPVAQYRMYTFHLSDIHRDYSLGEYIGFNIITCLIALIGCAGYAVLTTSSNYLPTIFLYCLYRLLKVSIDVLHAEDQRNDRMDYIGVSLALQGVASVLAFIAIFGTTSNLNAALIGMSLAVAGVGLLYDLRKTKQFDKLGAKISGGRARNLLIKCLPIVLASLACSLTPAIPRQCLLNVQGENALGIYASIAAPIAIIQMGANYVYYPLLGYFAQRWDSKDRTTFYSLLVQVTIGMLAVGVGCIFILKIFGAQLLSVLFGPEITSHLDLVNPMIACSITTAYMWFINDLLVSLRLFKWTVLGSLTSLILAITTTNPAVQTFGMNGVSYTLLISYASGVCVMIASLIIANYTSRKHSRSANASAKNDID